MGGDDRVDPVDHPGHLRRRRAGERQAVGEQGVQLGAAEAEPLVGGEPVEQLVAAARRRVSRMARATATRAP